ncbi:Molybdopterin-synthase adenylyltransferase [Pseudobythopirellula maris]|uniref:Molybdopterin-synthase adenylyltransferase n=1 Tax=Pseudobythopirellula maris TaxID=2527991 RepID=A0A5C5ZLQ0_9BACT|nr:ThiF family adenylyltransferase [Pseudobythopirellula maris]TWT87373.1 Molybdopterin-synthase adenylyltransferase [Pseudobythopirellula maris]
MSRYSRQTRFAPIGDDGQRRLSEATALVAGCGALGTHLAEALVRAGVGRVRLVDRDYVELSNLQRQALFDEADVAAGLPKAVAAAAKLRRINSEVTVEPVVADVTHRNIAELAEGAGVVVDGADNFELRLLVNDYCVKHALPWVYGGVIGAEGQTMPVLPGETACLACIAPEPPPVEATPTCDSAGVLGPAVSLVASLQAVEALKILSGNLEAVSRKLTVVDLWSNRIRQLAVDALRDSGDCPACGRGEFPWLEGRRGAEPVVLCGRNAVQLSPPSDAGIDLVAMQAKLAPLGQVTANPYLLRLEIEGYQITLFADGRAIVAGVEDPAEARSVLARTVGS